MSQWTNTASGSARASSSNIHIPKQVLRNQEDLVWEEIFKRNVQLQKIDTVEQLGDTFPKGLTHVVFLISLEEDQEMVILSTPHKSNVLVPVLRGSVIPGHGDPGIYLVLGW